MNKRYETNIKILKLLTSFFDEFPDQRFGQALTNLGFIVKDCNNSIIDPYYEESIDSYERMFDTFIQDLKKELKNE